MIRRLACVVAALALAACGSSSSKKPCDATAQTGCATGQFCETQLAATSGAPSTTACFAPVFIEGTVVNPTAAPATPVNDARVVALDTNRAPVSTVAVSAGTGTSAGTYKLSVRATRDSTGKPVQANITLRADAQGYQSFPGGDRTALPIDLSTATNTSGSWVVSSPLTALQLLPIGSGAGQSSVHGIITGLPSGSGALIVAEPAGFPGGFGLTGVADSSGAYAIYNLQTGMQYVVTAYVKGMNYAPLTTPSLPSGDTTLNALQPAAGTGATLAGGLIFNNGASTSIEVALVVKSTYDAHLDRGETPPGLTVPASSSSYSFTGVPDGSYVVLAPFGLTGDVRDVSGVGNTAAPYVTITSGAVVGTPPSFKIIPAVDLVSIGGTTVGATPTVVTTPTPVFVWQTQSAYSSAASYQITVYDSFGNVVWGPLSQAALSGTNQVTYQGPANVGMPYQLRIQALSGSGAQLSQTEDLAGVFIYQP